MNRIKRRQILLCLAFSTAAIFAPRALALETIDPKDFVAEASAKSVANVESGKLALTKTRSRIMRDFARSAIKARTENNKKLAAIARKKNLRLSTQAELANKTRTFILKQRQGAAFDEAFITYQITVHEETISLYNRAAVSDDTELANFARTSLPKLEDQLHIAQDIFNNLKGAPKLAAP